MAETQTYPIGEQDFKALRLDGSVYVDKTRFIAKMLEAKNKYCFLARPRRFGKSLFLSTLRYFFEGERSLFRGLDIDSFDWEWKKYPVLHLDLNAGEYADAQCLEDVLEELICEWEDTYGLDHITKSSSARFRRVIKAAHAATGLPVVILVDEYDKPLVHNLDNDNFEALREKLASLYSNFKTCAPYLKLVFLTGVSRFSRLSVFSGLNNLKDLTFLTDFADICGITDDEMKISFLPGIEALAAKMGVSCPDAYGLLKSNYDGYRFAADGSDIYNPWSLLNCLANREILNYWNQTGIPTLIAKTLKKIDADLEQCFDCNCSKDDLYGLDLQNTDPTALLYQTGYITIKHYDQETERFRLGIPNKEVKTGLFKVLLPYYAGESRSPVGKTVSIIVDSVCDGKPDKLMSSLQTYFAGIPYSLEMDNENNFHNAFYILTTLLGLQADAEVQTSDGRIDMVLKSKKFIYVIELKFDGTAREALEQIERKRYALKYADDGRTVFRIGANFSSSTRTVEDWKIED